MTAKIRVEAMSRASHVSPVFDIVHRPGQVRSMFNCEWSDMAHLLLPCEEPYRRDLKPARISSEKIFGCSQAAKWPPLGNLLQWISLGYARSAQLRGAG
jgi:hypothetical protein